MESTPHNATGDYQPEKTIGLPVLYAWPPRPLATLRYLLVGLLFPWGYFLFGLAFVTWEFLTPSFATMATLEPGWIALLWLRNAGLLCLVAGGLHWYLYMRRAQQGEFKFHRRWLATDDEKFLWGNQVRDNMFWSLVSGVSFWTAYEAVTYWIYASGRLPTVEYANPLYHFAMFYVVIAWSTAHFYFVHRFLHYGPVYRVAHELHHRNVNTGPWTGISMHPLEHSVYFTVFVLWWFVPVHPIVIILTGFFQGLSPAISHSGFDFIKAGRLRLSTGDWYHQLHHQYFNFNYGNTPTPFDRLFDSWHDGSKASLERHRQRQRERRRQAAG